jgi:cation diffusion facilitator CzcD-associated flavoprotein CzcO
VAERFDVRRHVRFSTTVASAVFDEEKACWGVATDQGQQVEARYLIMATGCLSIPKDPGLDGLDTFEGPVYHTARWPHTDVDLAGQRVAVIGTGSSGVQAIPFIAARAAQVVVFQRTPAFSMPARNAPLDPDFVAEWKAHYRTHREEARTNGFGRVSAPAAESALSVSATDRQGTYEERYQRGRLTALLSSYLDLLVNAEANDTAADFLRSKIRGTVTDPDVAEALIPWEYPFGTKRPCLDTDYYESFNRDNVQLVDLRRTPLLQVRAEGVETTEALYPVDVLVLATGFDAMTGALTRIDIRGRDGVSLRQKWMDGPRTFLGLAVAGFPNMFTITGPQSPSVLSNMMVSIEQHVEWIVSCLDYLRQAGHETIEATPEAEEEWGQHVAEVAGLTLYPRAASWYMGANVPNKPRVFLPYIGGMQAYTQRCEEVAASGYRGFALGSVTSTEHRVGQSSSPL